MTAYERFENIAKGETEFTNFWEELKKDLTEEQQKDLAEKLFDLNLTSPEKYHDYEALYAMSHSENDFLDYLLDTPKEDLLRDMEELMDLDKQQTKKEEQEVKAAEKDISKDDLDMQVEMSTSKDAKSINEQLSKDDVDYEALKDMAEGYQKNKEVQKESNTEIITNDKSAMEVIAALQELGYAEKKSMDDFNKMDENQIDDYLYAAKTEMDKAYDEYSTKADLNVREAQFIDKELAPYDISDADYQSLMENWSTTYQREVEERDQEYDYTMADELGDPYGMNNPNDPNNIYNY